MRGSVQAYQTRSGRRWMYKYDLPPGSDGKRKPTTRRGFRTRREAEAELRKALGSVEEGRHVDHSTQNLAVYPGSCSRAGPG